MENNFEIQGLETCKQELEVCKDQLVRISADFQNYKKRSQKERDDLVKMLKLEIVRSIIPLIDDLDFAFKAIEKLETSHENKALIDGFILLRKNFESRLKNLGVSEVDCSEVFDPNFHEAIMQVEVQDVGAGRNVPEKIVEVFSRGFLLEGELLRPAKVSVSK